MTEKEALQIITTKYCTLRTYQKKYFTYKQPDVLKQCKQLESELDRIIVDLITQFDLEYSIAPEQPKLF